MWMQKNSWDRKRLFRQWFRVSVERVLAEEDVDAGGREISELLRQRVDAVAGSDDVLVADQSSAASSSADSEKVIRLTLVKNYQHLKLRKISFISDSNLATKWAITPINFIFFTI